MKVASVINYKGGVGKTTLTANIGAEIAGQVGSRPAWSSRKEIVERSLARGRGRPTITTLLIRIRDPLML